MASETSPFDQVAATPGGHFRLMFYAAVLCILAHLARQGRVADERRGRQPRLFSCFSEPTRNDDRAGTAALAEFPFLQRYLDELKSFRPKQIDWSELREWWQGQLQAWESDKAEDLPLKRLEYELGLSFEDRLLLMLAGLVEEDVRFGSLFAKLQEPLPVRRPCAGLLIDCVFDGRRTAHDGWEPLQELLSAGLILAENLEAPRSDWSVRVPPPLWDAIRGRDSERPVNGLERIDRIEFPSLEELIVDATLREQLARLPALLSDGQVDALIVRGMANSGRRTILGALARSLGRDALICRWSSDSDDPSWSLLGPLCTLTSAFPLVSIDPGPGEKVQLPALRGYRGALGVTLRREGGVNGPSLRRALTLNPPLPGVQERRLIWERALDAYRGPDLETIVERYLLPLGSIKRVAETAIAQALLARRRDVRIPDVQLAYRTLDRQALDTLAQRLEGEGDWTGVVVNEVTESELYDLERRCRHRERLLQQLGKDFPNGGNRGVRALFTGPSGTGKTLAAKTLAAVLNMDLYRVDLASVVNKYIGETEKQLSRLLARAEELDVILLIDEGDALMTNRTDVKSANDRYANLETNYLLQRLETYQGIVVVTTNAGKRIDQAFQRRFDALVDFIPPGREERRQIWEQHLPGGHLVSADYLRVVALNCALTGGQIRNTVMLAALLALDAGRDGRIGEGDLRVALSREHRKSGGSYPLAVATTRATGQAQRLTRFLSRLG